MTKDDLIVLAKQKRYLGDGLYVHFDGWHVVLTAPRESGDHYVALEPSVLENFDLYKEDLKNILMKLKGLCNG